MSLPASYQYVNSGARLHEGLQALIESKELNLSGLQKNYLRARWQEQVLALQLECGSALRRYQLLRVLTVVGCLLLLMLVSLKIDEPRLASWALAARYLTVLLSLLVALSVVIEHVFDYGGRWRQAANMLERLQTEGWRFFQLSGHYRHYESHADAFPAFANLIEDLSQREVEVYSSVVARERRKGGGAAEAYGLKKSEPTGVTPEPETTAAAPPAPAPLRPNVMTRHLGRTRG